MRTRTLAAGIAGFALLTAACGTGDDNSASSDAGGGARRVDITMVDIDFEPQTITVAKGESVEFSFSNEGKVRHEAYFGSPGAQADHAMEMAEEEGEDSGGHDEHGGGRDDDDKITVEPGKRGDLTYRFEEPGTYEIGCHEPGHYEAGMKITVNVT